MDDNNHTPRTAITGDTPEETKENLVSYLRHLMNMYSEYPETPEGLHFELAAVYETIRGLDVKTT